MSNKTFKDWLRTLGAPEDPVATDTSSEWSAMSLLKAIFGKINDGSLAASVAASAETFIRPIAAGAVATIDKAEKRVRLYVASTAENAARTDGFAAFCAGIVAQVSHYRKLTRADSIATAADAVSTAADAAQTAGDAVVSQDAANRAAGYSMAGGRAVLAQKRAETAQAAAEAAAASVPSAESLILPVHVFS